MRENSATHPSISLPTGFARAFPWEPGQTLAHDEKRSWRLVEGIPRAITDHNESHVALQAIQHSDGTLVDVGIELALLSDLHLNSDQARELAAALLEAAAEVDRWAAR